MDYEAVFQKRAAQYNEACFRYPKAREEERQKILKLLDVQAGETILDIPAGAGYLADGIAKNQQNVGAIICAEPVAAFAAGIATTFEHKSFGCETFDLENESVHRVGSLAGLHHVLDKQKFFDECFRTLKPQGILVAADVLENSPVAEFLNGPVDRYSSTGHQGIFFKKKEFSEHMKKAGFQEIEEEYYEFEWAFPNKAGLLYFCRRLFGFEEVTDTEIERCLQEHFTIRQDSTSVFLPWALLYAKGEKG